MEAPANATRAEALRVLLENNMLIRLVSKRSNKQDTGMISNNPLYSGSNKQLTRQESKVNDSDPSKEEALKIVRVMMMR